MNIQDTCFDESDMFLDVCIELAFVLTSTISFDIYSLPKFEGILCIYVVRIYEIYSLHNPNARRLAYCSLYILAWEFMKMLNCLVVPIWWTTWAFCSFSNWIWLVKGPFKGIKHGMLFYTTSSIVINRKLQGLFMSIFPCVIAHLSCFKIL